jgi:predicted molibdopterin-dependent oxidoreductase YjgC
MRIHKKESNLPPIQRGQPITVRVDDQPVEASEGETVAAVLLAEGIRTFRHTPRGEARGIFCGMGICYECLVTIDGTSNVRACVTLVSEGMVVETRSQMRPDLESIRYPEGMS